jgi:hypothetical protein
MNEKACSKIPGGFMKKQFQPLLLGALVLFLSVGISLNAQQTTPQNQTPNQQAQPAPPPSAQQPAPPTSDEPAPPPSAQSPTSNQTPPPDQGNAAPAPGQTPQTPPDAQAQPTPPPTGVQAFSGTIVQQGDRYMLKDEASGQTYDLDHQAEVQKFVGKRVKVHGTLDPTGKMIHLQ